LNFAGSAGGTTQPAYEWQRKVNNAWQGVSGEASWRFTPDAAGTYRLKVTEGASGSQTQFFSAEFTVTASQGPLTLGFRNPAAAQSEIPETHGNDSGTGTGFYLTSSVSDLFTAARGTEFVRPVVKIESRQADGTFALDERFAVKADGRLSIKAGQSLDFESEHNPKGLIELRITVRDTAGNMTKLHVPIQLTDVANELPVGNLALRTEYGGSEEAFDPDSRLPLGTTFLVDENAFHDPEGVALTFTYKWMTWSRAPSGTVTTKLVGTGTSFTPPERHNQYKLELNVSDGSNAITAEQAFYVYALMPIHSTTFTYVENDPPYNGYLTTISPEFAQAYLESRELFIYKVNGVPVNDQNWNDLQFEIRNTYQLWMKTGATFDFEKYATYEQGSPRPASVSIEVVLRHSAGGGDALADEIFHFHVADVPENPIVTLNPIAALRGNDPAVFDFTLGSGEVLKRLAIYDPDDLAGEGKPGDLRYELSDERFELAAHDPDVHNKIVPRHLAGLHYSLKIKDGAQFDANETVPLTITAYEGAGTDVDGALTLTITIRPPTSGQSSGQGGGRANTEVVSYDDFSPDAGVEELGMVQNDFL
jgi:hypothetical protein